MEVFSVSEAKELLPALRTSPSQYLVPICSPPHTNPVDVFLAFPGTQTKPTLDKKEQGIVLGRALEESVEAKPVIL